VEWKAMDCNGNYYFEEDSEGLGCVEFYCPEGES